jgi:hypothetical protein
VGSPAEYAERMRDLRTAKARALAAWESLASDEERIQGLEAERDDLIAEAERAEAAGDKYGPAYWNRRDAAAIQERIDKAKAPKCPTCGGATPGGEVRHG